MSSFEVYYVTTIRRDSADYTLEQVSKNHHASARTLSSPVASDADAERPLFDNRTRAMVAAQEEGNGGDKVAKGAKPQPTKPMPRKRVRTNKEVTRVSHRGGKLSLKRILDMPPEVFNEVATHLMPADLLSLARSNKFFRKMFMSRSSRLVWQTAFENIPNLPACPPDLCEPQYASLLFSRTCSKCGTRVNRPMDPFLHVRLCNPCRDEDVIEVIIISHLIRLVPRSDLIKDPRIGRTFTLRSEMIKVRDGAENEEAFPEWCEARVAEMDERQRHGEELKVYLKAMEEQRRLELRNLEAQRKQAITARLLEEGWTERDIMASPANFSEWFKLTCQPKPLTDRIWNNMYPKLVPMLKSNRTYHEEVDRKDRRRNRITRIGELVATISQALPPLVQVTFEQAAANQGTNEPSTSATLSEPASGTNHANTKVEMPFPSVAELLTWPMINNIVENDTSPEDSEMSFNEIQEEFNQAVIEWRNKVEQDLVDVWNAGRIGEHEDETKPVPSTSKGKGKGKGVARTGARRVARTTTGYTPISQSSSAEVPVELVLPELTITYGKLDGTTTTNLSDLSSNLQFLLRAGTMFMGGVHRSYPAIVPPGIPFGRNMGTLPESLYGRRWNVEGIQRDDEASATAKELLARVGRPGATTAEMKALGGNFRCGRCTEPLPDNWEAMVLHYTKERLRWKLVQERMREDPQSGFVYHDIHALSPSNAKPFAHYMTPQAAEEFITEHTSQVPYMMVCRLCERMGIEATFFHTLGGEVESPMVAHLRNVHDIAQAVPGQHFQRWMHDFNIFDPTSSEDEEGEDDEDDEDEFWEW